MRPAARSPLRDALGSSLLRAAQPTHRRAPARAAAALADPAAAADHAAAALALPPAAALLHLGDLAPWAAAAARRAAVVADAAAAALPAASPPGAAAAADAPKDDGFLAPLVHGLEFVLARIRAALDAAHVPYSYGWSVVALTAAVKAATLPLVKQQVESTLSVQALKPQIDAIKAKYGEDKDAVSRETSALYEKAKVNPLAGCLPTLATLPIFIGLYRSLTASLDAAGPGADGGAATDLAFYWIPTLAGPTSVAAQRAGAGAAWLLPLVDGAPPVGWETAARYLVLPAAVVAAQYATSAIIAPPVDKDAENAGVQKALQL
jgi:YidC/Oxa1 family membrane protein insertase